jgi:NAD-dependent SIR2 family protein deacetylase
MVFIHREVPSTNEPSFLYRQAIETLADTLLDPERQCVFFLGAGASIDETAPQDLPTGQELSQKMAKEIGLEWHRTIPLSTIAFYYEFLRGRDRLVRLLQREIASVNVQPSATVRTLIEILAQLERIGQRNIVITTNYDQHFERAYAEKMGRPADVLIYQGAQDPHAKNLRLNRDLRGELQMMPSVWLQRKPTTLFKMHGCISQPENQGLVITEEDYINFLTNALSPFDDYKRIPTAITGRVAEGTIIFLGYSLEDWNFRTIFKATVEAHTHPGKSFAVQFWNMNAPEDDAQVTRREATTAFWGRKGVDIINAKADRFMQDLLESVTKVRV